MTEQIIIAQLDVEHSKCEVRQHIILDANYNGQDIYIKFNIETPDWDDLDLTVIFDKKIESKLSQDYTCLVPQSIINNKSEFKIGLYGVKEDYVINTNLILIKPFQDNYKERELFNPYFLQKTLKNRT